MDKPIIGQKMYAECIYHRSNKPEPRYCTVTKVGRKYFYVVFDGWSYEVKIDIDTWRESVTIGCPEWQLYVNELHYKEVQEAKELYRKLKDKYFCHYNNVHDLSLNQLKRIMEIVEE